MIDPYTITILDKFVTNVFDEETGFTNFFFSLKPVTFEGGPANIIIEFEFTLYDGPDQIYDNNRNMLSTGA